MTTSGDIGFGTNQIVGLAFGMGVVVCVFASLAWLSRRRKLARNERSPQSAKILRPSGHSLSCRIEELAGEWDSAVVQSVMAGAVFGLCLSGLFPVLEALVLRKFTFEQIRTAPGSYIILSFALLVISAAAWIIANVVKAVSCDREMRNARFGLRGEQAVAEALADGKLAAAGYLTFNDVPGDGKWNIDHVVIGPGGVFVLETKARARRKSTRDQPESEVLYDGKVLQFPWCYDDKAAEQAKRNADWVRRFLEGFAPKDIIVQPVVVVPGWYVKAEGNYPVKAMNAKYLVHSYLLKCKRLYSEERLQPIVRAFEERCRNLEF